MEQFKVKAVCSRSVSYLLLSLLILLVMVMDCFLTTKDRQQSMSFLLAVVLIVGARKGLICFTTGLAKLLSFGHLKYFETLKLTC